MMTVVRNGKPVSTEWQPSKRDIDLLIWLSDGKRYKEIAVLLHCKQVTVHHRMKRLMAKFGTKTGMQTLAAAFRRGFLT